MTRLRQLRLPIGDRRGFTLIELLIVVAIIGILAAIAIPLYNNMQQRARVAKAQADVRAMASAVSLYAAHMGGGLPSALGLVTASSSNSLNQTSGPFLGAIPSSPSNWSVYAYSADTVSGVFTISAAGDGTTARAP